MNGNSVVLLSFKTNLKHYTQDFSLEQVHLDYLEAGADIILTASYQVICSHPLVRIDLVLVCVCIDETELLSFVKLNRRQYKDFRTKVIL